MPSRTRVLLPALVVILLLGTVVLWKAIQRIDDGQTIPVQATTSLVPVPARATAIQLTP